MGSIQTQEKNSDIAFSLALSRNQPKLTSLNGDALDGRIYVEIRPDTRLPQSRAGGQEHCWSRSSRLKKLKNAEKVTSHPRIAHGQRYPMPCLG